MKKKNIISLLIVASVSVGAAAGTYATFKSTAGSKESKIKAGKIEINGQRNHAELGEWINTSSVATQIKKPGDEITLNPIEIQNTGDLNMIVKPSIELAFTTEQKDNNGKPIDVETGDLNKFMISPTISAQDNTLEALGLTTKADADGYVSLTDFKNALENYNRTIKPDEKVIIGGHMKLDNLAENDYEGTGVSISLNVTAEQE